MKITSRPNTIHKITSTSLIHCSRHTPYNNYVYYTLGVLCNAFFLVDYSTASDWPASNDKEQVISPHVRYMFQGQMIDLTRIIMTNDQCKNDALSAKGVNIDPIVWTLDSFWNYWAEAAEEDLLETRPRSIKSLFWWGMKRRCTLQKTKRTWADRVKLLGNVINEATRTHSHNSVV